MKTLRLALALSFAALLAASTQADEAKDKSQPAEKICDCVKDNKEGKKNCATADKACCCTGEKAQPTEKKPEDKK